MKKLTYLVVVFLLLFLYLLISKQFGREIGEPENAVKKFAMEQKFENAEQIAFSNHDRAAESGGYFILGQYPNNHAQLFYTWVENNKWNVVNICEVDLSQDNTTLSGNPTLPNGNQTNWGYSMISLKSNPNVESVVGYTRLSPDQKAKPIPFSFTKVGSFPLWVHKFPQNIGGTDSYKAFDRLGNEVWSSQ